MIVIVCLPCALAIRVLPDVQQTGELESLVGTHSEFWPNRFPCPRCDKTMHGMLESEADPRALAMMEMRDLSAVESFQLFNGLGFPDEQNCTLEALNELLRSQPVRKVHGTDVLGSTRCVAEYLELWDGTRVYLGAAPAGAVVYRIARPSSAVERVERGLPR
jgi:hypothetical protein